MKKFVGKLPTKKVPFMDDEIEIRKLTAGAVKRIGAASKTIDVEEDALSVVAIVLNEGVVLEEGEEPITAAFLEQFTLDDLNKLSNEIMAYAGVVTNPEGNAS